MEVAVAFESMTHRANLTWRLLRGYFLALAVALTLACADESVTTEARPHESRLLNINGVRLEVLDWGGDGPALILLHGAGTSPHYFDAIARKLSGTFRVISYARRGHGRSETPADSFDVDVITEDLRQVMDSLDIERATLLGHSFAGGEITRFAALYSQRVSAVLYLDAHYERFESPWADLGEGRPVVPCYEPQTETMDEFRECMQAYLLPGVEWDSGWEEMIQDMVVDGPGPGIGFKIDSATVIGSMPAINAEYRREYERVEAPVVVWLADGFYIETSPDTAWNSQARWWHENSFGPAREWTIDRFTSALPDVDIEILPGTAHLNIIVLGQERIVERLKLLASRLGGGG